MPSGFVDRIAGRDLVADQDDASRLRQLLDLGFLHHRIDADQLTRSGAGEQMIQRQHRVRLAAAEVGLELHDRIAALRR